MVIFEQMASNLNILSIFIAAHFTFIGLYIGEIKFFDIEQDSYYYIRMLAMTGILCSAYCLTISFLEIGYYVTFYNFNLPFLISEILKNFSIFVIIQLFVTIASGFIIVVTIFIKIKERGK
ncbi:MAG: hypothetical protein EAX96_03730 [Candidatus Lokiarchaeota archaeon]|nr:hypothetical protein [Candidatus Lokiarchaeota archaeon]